jgi:hypothetical protein
VFLSEEAAAFMNTCPRDDLEFIIQDAIDSLLFKIIGGDDNASDFSPLLAQDVPVYATHTALENFDCAFPVTMVADFRNNGLRYADPSGDGALTEAYEIDACIYIASPGEMQTMLASWHRTSGNAPKYVD